MANQEHLAIIRQRVQAWNPYSSEANKIPNLDYADLSGADLNGAALYGVNLVGANLEGVSLINADLCEANLSGANLSRANLWKANLKIAQLTNANLSHTNLNDASLNSANLSGANLTGADLYNSNFSNTNLCRANFNSAHVIAVNLRCANLHNADFKDANVIYANFTDCDLSDTQGLDFVLHRGPSSIGIDTIYKSQGKIPGSFLRGCGVPEGFITEMHSLVGAVDGIQFYSCFISYSGQDEDFAKRLYGKMRDTRLRVWFAPEDMKGGDKLHEQIETAIRMYDKLLIVLSESSLQSEWVMDELRKGFKAERDTGKRKLFPVRLTDYETLQRWECRDSVSGKDLAEEVRQYFIPDFSNWKDHDQFEAAFSRLLKDLRAEDPAK